MNKMNDVLRIVFFISLSSRVEVLEANTRFSSTWIYAYLAAESPTMQWMKITDLFTSSDEENHRYCVDNITYTISSIVGTLHWQHVVMIYDSMDELFVLRLAQTFERYNVELRVSYYDVAAINDTEIRDMLSTSYKATNNQYVLIIRDNMFRFLKLVNGFDNISNKTTNFRMRSKWIIWHNVESNNNLLHIDLELQNIISLYCEYGRVHPYELASDHEMKPLLCLSKLYSGDHNIYPNGCPADTMFPLYKYKLNRRHILIGTIFRTAYDAIVDELTKIVSQDLNFTYTFIEDAGRRYAVKINGSWQGLLGMLIRREVDIVIADLTVSTERMEVVDFVSPAFLTQQLGVLYRKDINEDSNWVKLFRPLQANVYYAIVGILCITAILIYYFENRPNNKSDVSIHVILLFGLLSRTHGLWPRHVSARILVAFFAMCCIVLTGTYIGNLTAKLTERIETKPFTSLEEMVALPDWKWGLNGGGLNQKMLENSNDSLLSSLWKGVVRFNKTDPEVLYWGIEKQIDKVLDSNDKYALIVTDPTFYMLNSTHCNLGVLDSLISSLNLAIAIPKNSYLKDELEQTMSYISSSGILPKLDNTRYQDNRPLHCRFTETKRILYMQDMLGLVLIITCGLGSAIVVLALEQLINHFKLKIYPHY